MRSRALETTRRPTIANRYGVATVPGSGFTTFLRLELVMPIIMRNDSDGDTFQVWAQEQENSCAVASIWMARNQALQKTVDQDEWNLAWQMYGQIVMGMKLVPRPPAAMTLNPNVFKPDQTTFQNMFASAGTYMDQVASKLATDGLTVTLKTPFRPGTLLDSNKLSDTTPAIILVGWYAQDANGNLQRNGGHFIVAASVTRGGKVVILDPWEGKLNEIMPPGPRYQGSGFFEQIVYISA